MRICETHCGFSPNSLTATAPQWQIKNEQADKAIAQALPIGLIAGLFTLIVGGLALFLLIRVNARELNLSPVVPRANPPSELSPAIVGKLTGQSHTCMGAIFDLTGRGVLEVQEEMNLLGNEMPCACPQGGGCFIETF